MLQNVFYPFLHFCVSSCFTLNLMAILLLQFNLDGEMERMEIEDLGMYLRNLVVRKSAFGVSDQPVKPQKLVNGSKF